MANKVSKGQPIYRQEPSRTDKNRQEAFFYNKLNKIYLKMINKCYSDFIDQFKVLYAPQKVFNGMCSKGGKP